MTEKDLIIQELRRENEWLKKRIELAERTLEPVVRCRDCTHMTVEQGLRYCNVWERFNGDGDVGFCNYGERRKDD